MSTLEGKVAIVTGAGRGIGRSEALLFAEHGATVIVNDVDEDAATAVSDEISSRGGQSSVHVGDASEWDQGEALVQQAISEFGKLDVLVNNAGILRDAMSFNMTEADWDAVIKVHLKGHFVASKFAGAYWRERAKAGDPVRGRIINTSSEAGLFGNAGQLNYAAAKAGIAAMTVVLARELSRYGATANAIAPRARTRMTETLLGATAAAPEGGFDEWHPDNVAPVVAWLATDQAADVNGQIFVVFGRRVWAMGTSKPAGMLEGEDRFTVDELIRRKDELFGDHSPDVPPFGFGM